MNNHYAKVLELFANEMPEADTELKYDTPFHLLIAVILSAQCTDKRVNIVTPPLFAAYPTAYDLAQASFEEVFEYVQSVSYPRNKAQHLIGMAKRLCDEFNGEVPSTLDELLTLPGVGRKTANVIQAIVFNKGTMAVDTHVFRVSHRLALVPPEATTPFAVEKCLTANIPAEIIPKAHHWLILHGRYVCTARKPKCAECFLSSLCPGCQLPA